MDTTIQKFGVSIIFFLLLISLKVCIKFIKSFSKYMYNVTEDICFKYSGMQKFGNPL